MAARLAKELKELTDLPPEELASIPTFADDDLFNWNLEIKGPPLSAYAWSILKVSLAFPSQYPFKPPKLVFRSKIPHPNIDSSTGQMCLGPLFSEKWSPMYTVRMMLKEVCSLLKDPNLDSPLDPELAEMYKNNRSKYDSFVRSRICVENHEESPSYSPAETATVSHGHAIVEVSKGSPLIHKKVSRSHDLIAEDSAEARVIEEGKVTASKKKRKTSRVPVDLSEETS